MNLFKMSPKRIERLNRIRAKGRSHYIFYSGVLGWGLSTFLLMELWRWHDVYGWHVPPLKRLLFDIFTGLLIWPVAGYMWGAFMWSHVIDNLPSQD